MNGLEYKLGYTRAGDVRVELKGEHGTFWFETSPAAIEQLARDLHEAANEARARGRPS